MAKIDFIPRLALLYGGIFGAVGVQLPFLPVWFAAKGLADQDIGFVLAAATVLRVATMPFSTRAADHFGNLKLAILLACGLAALFLTGLALSSGLAAILAAYALASAASGTALPLTEAYAWRGLAERGRAYGPVRVWASAAFIAGALATGALTRVIEPAQIIWLLVGVYWWAVIAAAALTPVSRAPARGRKARVAELFHIPALIGVVIASALVQASHALLYGFASLQWAQQGLGGFTISALWVIGVVAESVLFVASARFPARITPTVLIGIGAAGATIRWTLMAFDPPLAALWFLQCTHAVSFAATYLGAVQFIAHSAPQTLAATAQGLLATANGLAMACGMMLSGVLYARYGMAAYAAMALIAASGAVVALVADQRAAAP